MRCNRRNSKLDTLHYVQTGCQTAYKAHYLQTAHTVLCADSTYADSLQGTLCTHYLHTAHKAHCVQTAHVVPVADSTKGTFGELQSHKRLYLSLGRTDLS
mmetsp:Transcript_61148/g.98929  ORF Transcript_61148/g.98929 Transcript_61148/m.98929 type:complete len:100 (-) Transcript_61148:13-312(-)